MSITEDQPQSSIEKVCPKCGRVLKREWKACPECGWTMKPQNAYHGFAIASIVCGIVGFFLVGFFFFGIILGSFGLMLGAEAVVKKDKIGYVGVVIGIIVVFLSIIEIIALFGNL